MQVDWVQLGNLIATVTLPIGGALYRMPVKTQNALAEITSEVGKTKADIAVMRNDVLRLNESHEKITEIQTRLAVIEYVFDRQPRKVIPE